VSVAVEEGVKCSDAGGRDSVFSDVKMDDLEGVTYGSKEHYEFVRGMMEIIANVGFQLEEVTVNEEKTGSFEDFVRNVPNVNDLIETFCEWFGEDKDICLALAFFTHRRNKSLFDEAMKVPFTFPGVGTTKKEGKEHISIAMRIWGAFAGLAAYFTWPFAFNVLLGRCIGKDIIKLTNSFTLLDYNLIMVIKRAKWVADRIDEALMLTLCRELPDFVRFLLYRVAVKFGGVGMAEEAGVTASELGLWILKVNSIYYPPSGFRRRTCPQLVAPKSFAVGVEFSSSGDRDRFLKDFRDFGVRSLGGLRVSVGYLPARVDALEVILESKGLKGRPIEGKPEDVLNPTAAVPPGAAGGISFPEWYSGMLAWDWLNGDLPWVLREWRRVGWLKRGTLGEYLRHVPKPVRLGTLALTLLKGG